jgi:hypothetical protein
MLSGVFRPRCLALGSLLSHKFSQTFPILLTLKSKISQIPISDFLSDSPPTSSMALLCLPTRPTLGYPLYSTLYRHPLSICR